jgi:hypothetical protein
MFERGLRLLTDSGDLPSGYGVTLDEIDGDGFDEEERINIGINRTGYPIALPSQIWRPRTGLWAQGLFAMTSILPLSL